MYPLFILTQVLCWCKGLAQETMLRCRRTEVGTSVCLFLSSLSIDTCNITSLMLTPLWGKGGKGISSHRTGLDLIEYKSFLIQRPFVWWHLQIELKSKNKLTKLGRGASFSDSSWVCSESWVPPRIFKNWKQISPWPEVSIDKDYWPPSSKLQ